MSRSSLWGIDNKFIGDELVEFNNSWWFSPITYDILFQKYLPFEATSEYKKKDYISAVLLDNSLFGKLNNEINNSEIQEDRVLWELTNQQIFSIKDKEFVVNCIDKFLEINNDFINDLEEHIFERFSEIANEIRNLNEKEYSYFVFKNTSCDDDVEYWFEKYNKETDEYERGSLLDLKSPVTELVVIEDNKIIEFIPNLELEDLR